MGHYFFNETVNIPYAVLADWAARIFRAVGMDAEDARLTAETLAVADARGVFSHGCVRVPLYVKRIETGCVYPKAKPVILRNMGATALVDGKNAGGQVVSTFSMKLAIDLARNHGVSFVTVRNSNHCGACAYYSMMALSEDMIGFSTSIGGGNLMAPYGGADNRIGNNPFSVAIPATERDPVVLDMALSVVAKGKIILAQKTNARIPETWAIDQSGVPTTAPAEALSGSIRPAGDYKGSNLSIVVGMLSSMLSGACIGATLKDIYGNFEEPLGVGHSFGAIRIDYLTDPTEFKKNVDREIDFIKNAKKAAGVEEVFMPGEMEAQMYRRQMREGIPMAAEVVEELIALSRRLGVDIPGTLLSQGRNGKVLVRSMTKVPDILQ